MKRSLRRRWPAFLITGVALAIVITVVIFLTNRAQSPGVTALEAVPDGDGGAILVWERDGRIHGSRVGAHGNIVWTYNLLAADEAVSRVLDLVSDGEGGAILAWYGEPESVSVKKPYSGPVTIRSQRIDPGGRLLWGDGVLLGYTNILALHTPESSIPQITSDGTGGAYIGRTDYEGLHLQKVDPEGKPLWGETVAPASLPADSGVEIVSDGAGGFVVLAREKSGYNQFNIHAQRFDASGRPLWESGGVRVYSGWPRIPRFQSDGTGGVFLVDITIQQVFSANYSGQNAAPHFISGQWLHGDGSLQWTNPGIRLRETHSMLGEPSLVVSDSGGATFLWPESPYGGPLTQHSLGAARIDTEGTVIWQNNSVFVADKGQVLTDLSGCDGGSGVFLAWRTGRWVSYERGGAVHAQILTDQGTAAFQHRAIIFDRSLGYQSSSRVVADDAGGVIIAAITGKNSRRGDMVYGQRLDSSGKLVWGERGIRLDR